MSDAYAAWAPHYPPSPHTALMDAEQRAMLTLLPEVAGAVVLDAACGTGRYLDLMVARGARHAIGVDASPEMLRRARAGAGSVCVRGDLRALPLAPATVDVATCGLALNDLAELGLVARELARVLRPGGRLLTSVLHPRGQALGWTRTFETSAGLRAVPCHWHARADLETAWIAASLRLDGLHEPGLGESGGESGGEPVAIVVAATKAGR